MPLSPWNGDRNDAHRGSQNLDVKGTDMTGRRMRLVPAAVGAFLFAALPTIAFANPPRPSWDPGPPWAPLACRSGEMCQISNLFWIMLILSGIIFLGVSGTLILSIVRYSARPGNAEPAQVFGNRNVELIWTIIPTVILAIAFIATVKTMNNINTAHGATKPLDVYAIGHQWWWEFQYPTSHNPVDTANEVHVPSGRYIHFHVESNDVIHSFWTPQLDRQVDANPGLDNAVFVKLDTPGIYSGDCYEYCGTEHAYMKFRLVVQTPAQFAIWLKHQQSPAVNPSKGTSTASAGTATASPSMIARGKYVFLHNTCVNCHAINGTPAGGAVGPNLTHVGSRWTLGAGAAPVSENDLYQWVRNPNTYKPGVYMPYYTFIPDKDLHALAAYLFSLK